MTLLKKMIKKITLIVSITFCILTIIDGQVQAVTTESILAFNPNIEKT